MTRDELAARLTGRSYLHEITALEEEEAKASGLLVLFGASDDITEMRGAISDEVGAYNGTTIRIGDDGSLVSLVDRDDEEVLEKYGLLEEARRRSKEAHVIRALWCAEKDGPSWTFESALPHSSFDIMEDGEVFCRGIVIDMRDVLR